MRITGKSTGKYLINMLVEKRLKHSDPNYEEKLTIKQLSKMELSLKTEKDIIIYLNYKALTTALTDAFNTRNAYRYNVDLIYHYIEHCINHNSDNEYENFNDALRKSLSYLYAYNAVLDVIADVYEIDNISVLKSNLEKVVNPLKEQKSIIDKKGLKNFFIDCDLDQDFIDQPYINNLKSLLKKSRFSKENINFIANLNGEIQRIRRY